MIEDYKQYNGKEFKEEDMKRSTKIITGVLTLVLTGLVVFNVIEKEDLNAINETVQGIDSILVQTDTTNAVTIEVEAIDSLKDSIK